MVAHVNALNWRTNLSARTVARKLLPACREGVIRRINWWSFGSTSESGNVSAGDHMTLVEGPLPEGLSPDDLSLTILRDDAGVHVLLQSAPGGSVATNTAPERFQRPFYAFPGGIWTVEATWILQTLSTGVKQMWSSIGFENIDIGVKKWQQYRRSSLNGSTTGEILQ